MASTQHFIGDTERYLFDLNGYIVIKNVFSKEEIKKANDAIDAHFEEVAMERLNPSIRNTLPNSGMAGSDPSRGRIDVGHILSWRETDLFKSVLDHPKLVPFYHEFLGKGYRMDHMPFVIAQNKGSEGFSLHGGTIDVSSGAYNHFLAYSCQQGIIRNSLMAASVVLADQPAGAGGYCVVRGSHKSNFKAPAEMINGDNYREFVYQPETEAGDVVMFSEGTVHGALPWEMDYQRRVALYRFAPATCCYGRSYMEEGDVGMGKGWPAEMYEGMTDTQKAVLLPPYATRLDRVLLDDDGAGTSVSSRSEAKKAFDKEVFGSRYF